MNSDRMAKHGEDTGASVNSSFQAKWNGLSDVAFAGNAKNRYNANIEEIRQKIENPLTIDSLKAVMSLYSEKDDVYRCLELANVGEKNYIKNTEDEENFRESLYKDWLDSLKQMSREEVQKAGKDFYIVGRYALTHPEIKTRKQLTDAIESSPVASLEKKQIYTDLVNSKCYDHASGNGWDFARNCQIRPKHRLYMNVPQDEVYRLAQLVKAGCDESGVKYDFKLVDQVTRADSFMMYLTDEMLSPTIKVLESIGSDHPEIIERLGEPPILSGKINDWLGYGSEPENGKKSFNEVRADIIQEVLDKHILDYARIHGHDMTDATYNGKKLNLNQYIAIQETNAYMKKLADDYKRVKRRNEIQGNPNKSIEDELGYGAEQLKIGSPLYGMLARFYAVRRENGETKALEFFHRHGVTALVGPRGGDFRTRLSIGDNDSHIVNQRRPVSTGTSGESGMGADNKVLKQIVLNNILNDEAEIKLIRDDILKNCEKEGIDPETFCFDKYVLGKT